MQGTGPKAGNKQSKGSKGAAGGKGFRAWHSKAVPKPRQLGPKEPSSKCQEAVTTMMLRNIPNKYMQSNLLQEIDSFGFDGTYDFFYLPMDMHNRSNVGYCFINFINPLDATKFEETFSNHRFRQFSSRKTGVVSVAHVQGLALNVRHFENRAITHSSDEQYRPVVLKGKRRVTMKEALSDLPTPQHPANSPTTGLAPISKQISEEDGSILSGASTDICSAHSQVSDTHSGSQTPQGGFQVPPTATLSEHRMALEEAICQLLSPSSLSGGSPVLGAKVPVANAGFCDVRDPPMQHAISPMGGLPLQSGMIASFDHMPLLFPRTHCNAGIDELLGLKSKLKDRLDSPTQPTTSPMSASSASPAHPSGEVPQLRSLMPPPPGLEPLSDRSSLSLLACPMSW